MRGEYGAVAQGVQVSAELPPRARRIQHNQPGTASVRGTTSACAENTPHDLGQLIAFGNYLRVRGEYVIPTSERPELMELPPRARRILFERLCAR